MRPHQLLHPQRPPAAPLHASTVLLLREAPDSDDDHDGPAPTTWQVLMTRRRDAASFAPGAYVFPGGGIEAHDAAQAPHTLHRPDMPASVLTAAIAAARESFEEMGLLLAVGCDGQPLTQTDVDTLDRHTTLWPQLRARGWRLDLRGMWQLAHWTAAPHLPKRFAVPFFIARMPAGQTPVADGTEQFEPIWVQPAQALQAHRDGRMPMIFPTIRTLQHLMRYPRVQDIFSAVAHGPLWTSTPRCGVLAGAAHICMENDPGYGELALVCPDGQPLHHLDWQSERPVALRKNLLRLTAPNPGTMTGPGTNSYLIGDATTGYIAIDPGPADAHHIQRLHHAAGGDIRHIICTHSHPDHAPGAWLLQQLCAATGRQPPVWGLPSGPHARADSQFTPDAILHDGDRLHLAPGHQHASPHTSPPPAYIPAGTATPPPTNTASGHTLRAIHTPGHTANHLCLLLEEDALLFTGDHILGSSTTIISPPDGDMTAYLTSLDRLAALCEEAGIEHLLPAHGHAMGEPAQVIARLKAHRLEREAKILTAMRSLPHGTESDWLPLAYADTPTHLWPIALHSLRAHVQRIQALKLA